MLNQPGIAARLIRIAVSFALLASCSAISPLPWVEAALADGPPGDGFVIPPGQEELLGDMLGRNAALPGGCTFKEGQISGPLVVATYGCQAGELALELKHPGDTAGGAGQTDKFALAVKSGSPPDGFTDALLARIREREARFEWLALQPPVADVGSRTPLVAGAVLAIAVVAYLLLRRRRAAHPAQ